MATVWSSWKMSASRSSARSNRGIPIYSGYAVSADTDDRSKIRQTVQHVSDADVCHYDLEWRYLYTDGDNVKVSDFHRASQRKKPEECSPDFPEEASDQYWTQVCLDVLGELMRHVQ